MAKLPGVAYKCPKCGATTDTALLVEIEETITTYRYDEKNHWHDRVGTPEKKEGGSHWECPVCHKDIGQPQDCLVKVIYTIEPYDENEEVDDDVDLTPVDGMTL